MGRIRSAFLGVGAFGLAPLLVSVASIISVPVMLAQLGQDVWVSVAIGQAAGELGRSVTIWGWSSVGLAVFSSLGTKERILYFLDSIPPRLLLFCLCCIGIGISVVIMPVPSSMAYGSMAVAGALQGLTGALAFIGGREAKNLILYNALPRAGGILLGTALLFPIPRVEVFALCTILGNLAAAFVPWLIFRSRRRALGLERNRLSLREICRSIREGFSAFLIGFIATSRMSLPVLLVPVIAPSAAPMIALADKFLRWGNTGLTPVMQYAQTGIPRAAGRLDEKARRGTRLVALGGALVALLSIPVAILLAPVMSSGQIQFPVLAGVFIGAALGLLFISAVTGNATLVLLGRTGTVARGSLVGLLALCLMIFPAGHLWGGLGVLFAYFTAELGNVLFQMAVLRRALRDFD
jgi:O-antigen/teichoic acid export membrane protein